MAVTISPALFILMTSVTVRYHKDEQNNGLVMGYLWRKSFPSSLDTVFIANIFKAWNCMIMYNERQNASYHLPSSIQCFNVNVSVSLMKKVVIKNVTQMEMSWLIDRWYNRWKGHNVDNYEVHWKFINTLRTINYSNPERLHLSWKSLILS